MQMALLENPDEKSVDMWCVETLDDSQPREERYDRLPEVEIRLDAAKDRGATKLRFVETDKLGKCDFVQTCLKSIAETKGLIWEVAALPKPPERTICYMTEDDLIRQMLAKINKHMTKDVTINKNRATNDIVVESTTTGRMLGYFQGDIRKAEKIAERIKSLKGVRVNIVQGQWGSRTVD